MSITAEKENECGTRPEGTKFLVIGNHVVATKENVEVYLPEEGLGEEGDQGLIRPERTRISYEDVVNRKEVGASELGRKRKVDEEWDEVEDKVLEAGTPGEASISVQNGSEDSIATIDDDNSSTSPLALASYFHPDMPNIFQDAPFDELEYSFGFDLKLKEPTLSLPEMLICFLCRSLPQPAHSKRI